MQRKMLRITQSCLLLTALVAGGLVFYRSRTTETDPRFINLNHLPKEGFAYHDTHGKMPGDPENGVQELKKFYAAIQTYRARHGGSYPKDSGVIMQDCTNEPSAYHVKNFQEFFDSFHNPDNQYGDSTYRSPNSRVAAFAIGVRPDGTPVGGPKPAGSRDLVGMSQLYVHQNIRLFNHEKSTENPVGVYLLLWDDGTVDKVPYDKVLYVETSKNNYQLGFPGQAGVSENRVTTYSEWHNGPSGKAGQGGKKKG